MTRLVNVRCIGPLLWTTCLLVVPAVSQSEAVQLSPADVSNYNLLKEFAKQQAGEPFTPRQPLPKALADLSYEQFREIQFNHERAPWQDKVPFWFETFHRGYVQQDRVDLFGVEGEEVERFEFSKDDFDYGEAIDRDTIPDDLGHAGVRIVGKFPGRDDVQEMLTFVGSSYFRARSGETVYGASARGLAVNVAMNQDEEFPFFRRFWILKPSRCDETVTVLAQLDSPSLTGAYQFYFRPGTIESTLRVQATLYAREQPPEDAVGVEKLGVAPLTSMWIWGDGLDGPPKDNRPGVHDSDGLLIESGEAGWVWRPFTRQPYPSTSFRSVRALLGFGILQRNRAFFHYEDYNAKYHLRPSIWITPDQPWLDGRVELLEIPGAHEGIDNIAAYWVPSKLPEPGEPLELGYSVKFFPGDVSAENYVGRATNFHIDRELPDDQIGLQIRFAGLALQQQPSDRAVDISAEIRDGTLIEQQVQRTETGDYLLDVTFKPSGDGPVDLSLRLVDGSRPLTELFSYLCPRDQPEFVYPSVYTRQE
ncbi:glucan biosynthesis protein G [Roseiconus nitratireducens]|uniref:Glucan biosynthesis protein G n=1 Tax=Roseiconus nitratireducens TaxID=2605748 RepID=A0A5M6CVX9_9BACT|nr:glucan biosynthesis protein [Roseiconus nitratireducens]KAA5538530.1 glucan biosynthesis protein G [Roseiconus nitratireducens]